MREVRVYLHWILEMVLTPLCSLKWLVLILNVLVVWFQRQLVLELALELVLVLLPLGGVWLLLLVKRRFWQLLLEVLLALPLVVLPLALLLVVLLLQHLLERHLVLLLDHQDLLLVLPLVVLLLVLLSH